MDPLTQPSIPQPLTYMPTLFNQTKPPKLLRERVIIDAYRQNPKGDDPECSSRDSHRPLAESVGVKVISRAYVQYSKGDDPEASSRDSPTCPFESKNPKGQDPGSLLKGLSF